ncbi:MAG: hypothetical protein FWC16_06190 [Defluviitaleaceae bacterium]|nr:hypothetical protein [Defluviitaleaceae bacterium]MCL2274498.1 hypothetical protein [Defluviitaleaceae bacterium]
MKSLCLLFVLLTAIFLSGCDSAGESPVYPTPTAEATHPPLRVRTIQELGATIEGAGTFWEDWWSKQGVFAFTDTGRGIFVPTDEEHPGVGMSYTPLMRASGLHSINDVRNFLLRFYCETRVDAEMGTIFIEYGGVLHFADARAGFPRFDWRTASHELVAMENNYAIVETHVNHGRCCFDIWERVALRFHMYDGKINYVERGSIVHATLDYWAFGQGHPPWQGYEFWYNDGFINIAPSDDPHLPAFAGLVEVDYTPLRTLRYGTQAEPMGAGLVIWASFPMYEFELINLIGDFINEEIVFFPQEGHGRVDILPAGYGYIVNNYLGMGTLPWSGFTFLDALGERHHFFMQHDNSDSHNFYVIRPFLPSGA